MASVLGIDIGTSSTKIMLLDEYTGVVGVESENYDVDIPEAGYAQQNPEVWWQAVCRCLLRLRDQYPQSYENAAAIGFSGQMHGLVVTDEKGNPVRPAILWLDQRAERECCWLKEHIPEQIVKDSLRNRFFTGFALPSLLWVKSHETENFKKIRRVLQPKDYIRFKMTGLFGTEATDASATLMFDIVKRDWAWDVLDLCGLPGELFPKCHESGDIQGMLSGEFAEWAGLKPSVKVIYGMGDQQAQSIGNGVFEEGTFICNIGTGGQISAFSKRPVYDTALRTQTFCHGTNNAYTVYGAILNAGMSLKWLKDHILKEKDFQTLSNMAEKIEAGSEGLIFLPYLTGERTPHMDTRARGMFFGLQLIHAREHMVRAVMEGVIFALRESMEILEQMGISCRKMVSSGGGASSPVWLQMQADIFNKDIYVSRVDQQACLGACMLAGTSAGIFESLEEACRRFVSYDSHIYKPAKEQVLLYDQIFDEYRKLYRNTKDI